MGDSSSFPSFPPGIGSCHGGLGGLGLPLLEDWHPHRTQPDPEGQVSVEGQQTDEQKLGEGLHRDGLRVDAEAEATGGSHVHEEMSLTTKSPAEKGVPFQVLESGQDTLLLLAGLFLGVEARWHDSLVSEADEGGLESEGEVGLLLQDGVLDRNVSVSDARKRRAAVFVGMNQI